jgi:radical SAM superfamily enzyme YgiQ (UPF0313 family)
MKIQFISPLPDSGFAYNQGIYWPVGLLTIASFLTRKVEGLDIEILDEAILGEARVEAQLSAPLVGIQASSCMTYGSVLQWARRAKATGAKVVLGGPFATELAGQILMRRPFIDAVVAGAGEEPMRRIVEALHQDSGGSVPSGIPGVWSRIKGAVVPGLNPTAFDYEECRPLDYRLLPIETYHYNYSSRMNPSFCGSFQIFTHFGCRFREVRRRAGKDWCSYCALSDILSIRDPKAIRDEIKEALMSTGIAPGSRVMLKCYGDNASALGGHLETLAGVLNEDPYLEHFELYWSMYAQSSFISPRLIEIFKRLKVWELYIGFDSANDEIQHRNGLGTSKATHLRAALLLQKAGIRIHAGFVLGCAGESLDSLKETVDFAFQLSELGNTDMYHAAPLVVLPGSPAFRMLCEKIPSLEQTDFLDTVDLQLQWLANFCPQLGDPRIALDLLQNTANTITHLGGLASSWGGWQERVPVVGLHTSNPNPIELVGDVKGCR